jgi:hypothetical protein
MAPGGRARVISQKSRVVGWGRATRHFAVSEDLRLQLAGRFRHNEKYEVLNRLEVVGNTCVVQVSRGVLNLESVP